MRPRRSRVGAFSLPIDQNEKVGHVGVFSIESQAAMLYSPPTSFLFLSASSVLGP